MGEAVSSYVVIRPAADLPAGFLPPRWDGAWIDRATMDGSKVPCRCGKDHASSPEGLLVAVPTGRFERHPSGVMGEVYEVRP